MARTLFDGGAMHGDLALCESALSVRCFNKLVDIGVPFPHNRFSEYMGYKTDHDPRQRATSAGPLTSRFMTEKLEAQVRAKNIRIFDGYKVIGIITDKGECKSIPALDNAEYNGVKCKGLLALNKAALRDVESMFVLFNCTNVVLATGGPAGLYESSVYPESQTGANGMAFEAGVAGRNLTEWQYGIASVKFRWNLSGSYQQVIPRYVSTDREGNDAREFLDAFFPDSQRMLDAIFLKGYQWPFDSRKITDYGSSLVDILVHQEIHQKGRRVFLDFKDNPIALLTDFSNLGKESYAYLEQSGALQATPIERLAHLNQPAIDLYKNNGIDLSCEMLEIAVCAQHNNGGLAVNCWWETNIPHLFAVGEAAGTHGIYRPGGSALNAGQAGSTRAAMFIARRYVEAPMSEADFITLAAPQIAQKLALARQFLDNKNGSTPQEIRSALSKRMSEYAAHIRSAEGVHHVKNEAMLQTLEICKKTVLSSPEDMIAAYENVDLSVAQFVYASAMENYIAMGGGSRGSCIIPDENGSCEIPDLFRYTTDNRKLSEKIQEVHYTPHGCKYSWEDVRPIPIIKEPFETVWRQFRDDTVIIGQGS